MNLEQIRIKYRIMWEQAEPGSVQEAALVAIIEALYETDSLLNAKNTLHAYEIMSSPGEVREAYRSARLELERAMRESEM